MLPRFSTENRDIMTVYLNNKETEVAEGTTLDKLLSDAGIIGPGIAVAINNSVVRKAMWAQTIPAEGDRITVITAVCGG